MEAGSRPVPQNRTLERAVGTIVWENPVTFFGQSGQLDVADVAERPSIDQTRLWEGNSVLRGQTPVVEGERAT